MCTCRLVWDAAHQDEGLLEGAVDDHPGLLNDDDRVEQRLIAAAVVAIAALYALSELRGIAEAALRGACRVGLKVVAFQGAVERDGRVESRVEERGLDPNPDVVARLPQYEVFDHY